MDQSGCLFKEREAIPKNSTTKIPRESELKQTQPEKQCAYTTTKYGQYDQLMLKNPEGDPDVEEATCHQPMLALCSSLSPAPLSSQEALWQSAPYGPLDMRLNQQGGRATIEQPSTSYQQHQPNLSYDIVLSNFDHEFLGKRLDIYDSFREDSLQGPSPESKTRLGRASVIQLAPSRLARPEVGFFQEEEQKKTQEETEISFQDNPVLQFTLEEEFKVVDFIVRIEDYSSKRLIFINNNFGDNGFPQYRTLTMENAARFKVTGKLPYDPVVEGRLCDLAITFHQLNIDHFFDEIKNLSREVKMDMLMASFPANYVICVAMVEKNLQGWNLQPLALGCEKVGKLKLKDHEKFTSPWAHDYADEVKFSETVARVAEVLGTDLKLQALYHMLVMISPCQTQVMNIQCLPNEYCSRRV